MLIQAKMVDVMIQSVIIKWLEIVPFHRKKYMEFDGKFLQYQSNNILYMDLLPTLSQTKNKCSKEHHNHAQGEQGIKKIEIQNQDMKSCAASINQNIENVNKQKGNNGQNEVQASNNIKNHTMLKMAFTGVTILQFSILFGLILIQFISSKIELSTLVTLITIETAIHVLLIGLVRINASEEYLKKQLKMVQREQEDKYGNEIEQLPTIPRINQQMCKRSNAKTKKIPYVNNKNAEEQKNTEQTIKKETFQNKKENVKKQNDETDENSFESYRIVIIILKIIQTIFVVLAATIFLIGLKVQNAKERQVIVVLSVITYLLATCSIGIFWQLYKKIWSNNRITTQRRTKRQQQNEAESQNLPKTIISIDQVMEVKVSDSNKLFALEKEEKQQNHMDRVNENSINEKRQEQNEKEQELCKIQIKKSVLKTKNKVKLEQYQQIEENIQRRKVEIDLKKIEYFQYSAISPSHSVVDESQINKKNIALKSKYGPQKTAQIKQRMKKEEMLRKNMFTARQARAKSLGSIEREPIKKEEEKIEDSFMADYYS